jgi:hypothetical protein
VIDNITVSYTSGGVIMNTNQYAENGISELSRMEGENILKEENFKTQITQATCIAGGKILVELPGTVPITGINFTAYDAVTGNEFVSSGNEIVELPEAEYTLTMYTEGKGCSAQWTQTFYISTDHNCNFPVISPNKDGIAEDYYIPYQGVTKIYDRYGVLKAELPTPSTWNATDGAGHLLPMGTYVLVCEGHAEIMITVVR